MISLTLEQLRTEDSEPDEHWLEIKLIISLCLSIILPLYIYVYVCIPQWITHHQISIVTIIQISYNVIVIFLYSLWGVSCEDFMRICIMIHEDFRWKQHVYYWFHKTGILPIPMYPFARKHWISWGILLLWYVPELWYLRMVSSTFSD